MARSPGRRSRLDSIHAPCSRRFRWISHCCRTHVQFRARTIAGPEFVSGGDRPVDLGGNPFVGAGGIGRDVGRLCAAIGMRVVGTRRNPRADEPLPPGFSEMGGAADLDRLLPDSDFVVICCQWTPETNRLFDKTRFALMKPGSVLVNVARGEIVDEDALAEVLERDHLRGAVLDVYVGEFEHLPPARLWSNPRVLITPHVSGASDEDRHGGTELFCENLRAYIAGRPLRNVIDWQRGY